MSLNVEAMTELVTALRSGEYPQGRGALRWNDTYCCLGVACEVAVRHGVIAPATKGVTVLDSTRYYYGPERDYAYLSKAVMEWFGFDDRAPQHGGFVFAWRNDDGVSQSAIADHFQLMLEADQAATLPEAHSRKGD